MKKIILHIGRHKSGTTSLQRAFYENRMNLNQQGIDYPVVSMRNCAHHEIAELFSKKNTERLKEKIFRNEKVVEFLGCLREQSGDVVILSSEAFQNCDARFIKDLLSEYDVKVVFYLRDQVGYLESAYLQHVHATDYHADILDFERYKFHADYLKFYEEWNEVFDGSVDVRVFDRSQLMDGDVVVDFFEGYLREELGFDVNYSQPEYDSFSANVSIQGDALAFKLRFNKVVGMNNVAVGALYQSLGRLSTELKTKTTILTTDVVDIIVNKYQESNNKLFDSLFENNPLNLDLGNKKTISVDNIGPARFLHVFNKLSGFDESILKLKKCLYCVKYRQVNEKVYVDYSSNIKLDSINHVYLKKGEDYIPLKSIVKNDSAGSYLNKVDFSLEKDTQVLRFDDTEIKLIMEVS